MIILYKWNNEEYKTACAINDWLSSNVAQWTLTANTIYGNGAFYV